jgi:hypothetical protein
MNMKELGTIEQEADDCRVAFAGIAVGAPVWCCHHEVNTEWLKEPAENRILFILNNKSKEEQALRLREFRPVLSVEKWKELNADYKAKLAPLDADYEAKLAPLYADYEAKLAPLDADYKAKRAPLDADLRELHRQEYPDTSWNGKSIFSDIRR